MNVRIEIDTRTFVRFWLVVIGFALTAFAIYSAKTALILIGLALFLAIALSTPVDKLVKILPSKSRVLSTALSYLAVVAVLGTIVFLVVPPIVEQTSKFIQTVPTLMSDATKQYSGINKFVKKYNLQPQVDDLVASIKKSTSSFATDLGSTIIKGIGSLVSTIMAGIIVFVLTFLMLVEGPVWLDRVWSVYKDKERMKSNKKLVEKMYNVVTSYVTGQFIVSSIAGTVAASAVLVLSLIFKIPANLIIPAAATIFLFSLIPMFGSSIGAVIITTVLALNDVSAAIIFICFFVLYQQVEGNFISPKIQSKKIDLSALAILIAVTIGIYLFGIAGGIISIPIAGCINVLADDYFARRKMIHDEDDKLINKIIN